MSTKVGKVRDYAAFADAKLEFTEAIKTIPHQFNKIIFALSMVASELDKAVPTREYALLAKAYSNASHSVREELSIVPPTWGLTYGFNNVYFAFCHMANSMGEGPLPTSLVRMGDAFREKAIELVSVAEARRLTGDYDLSGYTAKDFSNGVDYVPLIQTLLRTEDPKSTVAAEFLMLAGVYSHSSSDTFDMAVGALS